MTILLISIAYIVNIVFILSLCKAAKMGDNHPKDKEMNTHR